MKQWDAERKELLEKRCQDEAAEKERKGGMLPSAGRRGSRS
jgi:hypothetical protein